ncbi:MAG: adenylyltransferase/cytidyltransferase family protein [Verrucomicrobiales bacterium]
MSAQKVLTSDSLPEWRDAQRSKGLRLIFTNGVFDLLHQGHATYLQEAKKLGDVLLVGLNSDSSVKALKGPTRPVQNEATRLTQVSELPWVDAVILFPEIHVTNLLEKVLPDIYVKGGDYTMDSIDADLRSALVHLNIDTRFVSHVAGVSTTLILQGKAQALKPR